MSGERRCAAASGDGARVQSVCAVEAAVGPRLPRRHEASSAAGGSCLTVPPRQLRNRRTKVTSL